MKELVLKSIKKIQIVLGNVQIICRRCTTQIDNKQYQETEQNWIELENFFLHNF